MPRRRTSWRAFLGALALLALALTVAYYGQLWWQHRLQGRRLRAEQHSDQPAVRVQAVAALARRTGERRYLDELVTVLVGSDEAVIRRQAANGLAAVAWREPLPGPVVATLTKLADPSEDASVLEGVLLTLAYQARHEPAPPDVLAAAGTLLVSEQTTELRRAAILVLESEGEARPLPDDAIAALAAVLRQSGPPPPGQPWPPIVEAAHALELAAGQRRISPAARHELARLARSPSPRDRGAAVRALAAERRRWWPEGYEDEELDALVVRELDYLETRQQAAADANEDAERQRRREGLARMFDRRYFGATLYMGIAWLAGLLAVAFLIYFIARGLALTGEHSSRALRAALVAAVWVGLSFGVGWLLFMGVFLFGHNSLAPPGTQLMLAALAALLVTVYATAGWGLGLLLRSSAAESSTRVTAPE